ncbi:aspartate-semialdehyde dehydrogenase [uncultured Veillonella sp.]|uniref:aspartate-semialdehyde dehydrogenase n=1 Tax=uncultured Veillonella sp. TaxID=159268 RepID=UPI0025E5FBEB|nr:aspartate-semialdehyde dehydrogenase [uncultured Veillonella sp.]MDY3974369.1 aspartate-semialdehyde dehydrogenase [Veillonella caviae]
MRKPNVAILGATGAVGQEFITLIEERQFPFESLKLLASARSAGKELTVAGKTYIVEEATPESFEGVDIALFAGGSISKTLAPEAVKRGAIVIDNSSAFRMDTNVPLVVPEVNPQDIDTHKGIIANPNCSTIIMALGLKPLYDLSRIKRVVVSTYQAVSGAGKEGIDELTNQVVQVSKGANTDELEANILPCASDKKHYPIAFNVIPQIDVFLDNDYTKEEMKMVNETQKIFHDEAIEIVPTTIRIPVYRSHSESVLVETEEPVSVADFRAACEAFPGLIVKDNPKAQEYPMPLYTSNQNDCEIGRIRKDLYNDKGMNFWIVGDQIRKGAALNALQIAEYIIEKQSF